MLRAGDTLRNPELAAFLSRLDGFAPAGLVTAEDLAAYAVVEREPLRLEYRGSTILTNPPPAFGGALAGGGAPA